MKIDVVDVSSYMSFRLLGSALPLLSVAQLKEVLSGDVMMHYGEHVVSAQVRASTLNNRPTFSHSEQRDPDSLMVYSHFVTNRCTFVITKGFLRQSISSANISCL